MGMIGWFSINVPSGLSLYYLCNTLLTMAQQIYLKNLGGGNVTVNSPVVPAGKARRTGKPIPELNIEAAISSISSSNAVISKTTTQKTLHTMESPAVSDSKTTTP